MSSTKISDIFSIVKKTFFVLKSNPILFVPKLVLALLYGLGILWSVTLAQKMYSLYSLPKEQIIVSDFTGWFFLSILLLLLVIVTYFIDLFFSGLYPILVNQAVHGKINFFTAISVAKNKISTLFFAGIILFGLIILSSVLESVLMFFFNLSWASLAVSFAFTFLIGFLFYFLFPILVFKNKGVFSSFRESIFGSLNSKKKVFIFSIIPFSVSVLKFALAFFTSNESVLIIFWFLVLLTGVVYTFHAVANQLLYEKINTKK